MRRRTVPVVGSGCTWLRLISSRRSSQSIENWRVITGKRLNSHFRVNLHTKFVAMRYILYTTSCHSTVQLLSIWKYYYIIDILWLSRNILWEIVKPNGDYEVYTVANYSHYRSRRRESITERGLSFGGFCHPLLVCDLRLTITPTDLRYNGPQITGMVRFPECFNTSNTTNTTTLRIQGELF